MVPSIFEQAQSDRKMGGVNRVTRKVDPDPSPTPERPDFKKSIQLPKPERTSPALQGAPKPLADGEPKMGKKSRGQPSAWKVTPEEDLRVAGHPTLQSGPTMVVTCRNFVQDAAMWCEDASITGPPKPERQVNVFIVGAERGVERPNPLQGLRPIECA